MKLFANIVVLILTALVPVPADDPNLAQVRGTWQAIGAEYGGETVPEAALEKITIIITGNHYVEKIQGKVVEEGTFTIRADSKPREIDILPTSGKDKGKRQLGIYHFKNDHLVLAVTLENHEKRPASFATQADDTFQIITFRRAKE